jgi:hypothetical protein
LVFPRRASASLKFARRVTAETECLSLMERAALERATRASS